jgi:tRNA-Thr(GGU) m(6)t(6)A37 methyltransferase TsaA
MEIVFEPIGFVRNDFPVGQKPPTWHGISSRIEFRAHWAEALSGLAGFSHVIVLCYLHLSQGQTPPPLIRPQRHPEMPLVGFFGTRTPVRPNPISVSSVPLVDHKGSILHVRDLDMYDGTPVLDVKPYLLRSDCHPQATEPEWIHRLRAIQDTERIAGQNT